MINRKYEIEGLDNIRLLFSCTFEEITFMVIEKTNNYRSIPVYEKKYTYDKDNFSFEDSVIEVMKEYFEKKAIEDEIGELIPSAENNVIVIPSLNVE